MTGAPSGASVMSGARYIPRVPRTMFDAAWPPASLPAPCSVAAGYVGDAPPAAHKWSFDDWRHAAALPGITELLAIGVYGPGRNPIDDARQHAGDAIIIAVECGFGPVSGNVIALDVEENVAAGAVDYVNAWAAEISRLAFIPLIYTSRSAGHLFAAHPRWLADWTGQPHMDLEAVATQYASFPTADLSLVEDVVPLWKVHAHEGPAMPKYVTIVSDPLGRGYWIAADNGGVFSYGVPYFGSMYGKALNAPIVAAAAAHDGKGYWLLGADGGVFAFGSARFLGAPTK